MITDSAGPVKPSSLHEFGMYLDHQWYILTSKKRTFSNDPIGVLDVTILSKNILDFICFSRLSPALLVSTVFSSGASGACRGPFPFAAEHRPGDGLNHNSLPLSTEARPSRRCGSDTAVSNFWRWRDRIRWGFFILGIGASFSRPIGLPCLYCREPA